MSKFNIKIHRADPCAHLPSRATEHSAGFDLHACFENEGMRELKPHTTLLIPTGLRFELPPFSYMLILPRSGLALNEGLAPINTPGLVDSDYRGIVGIALHNHSRSTAHIVHGERIAQALFFRGLGPNITFTTTDELNDTSRGDGGFGSTGRN